MSAGSHRFLRDNAFLVAAGVLPLLVVAFFVLSTTIPRWTVPPPGYDLVLRAEGVIYVSWLPNVVVDYRVRDRQVEAVVRQAPPNSYHPQSALFLFDHRTMSVQEIPVDLPTDLSEKDPPRTIVVTALSGRRIVADAKAPDGYAFENRSSGGPGLVGEVFGMSRYEATAALVNRGRVVRLQLPAKFRYPASMYAVGWILEDTAR
jgi:hypothetical protein